VKSTKEKSKQASLGDSRDLTAYAFQIWIVAFRAQLLGLTCSFGQRSYAVHFDEVAQQSYALNASKPRHKQIARMRINARKQHPRKRWHPLPPLEDSISN
jgi:hypothetical protein